VFLPDNYLSGLESKVCHADFIVAKSFFQFLEGFVMTKSGGLVQCLFCL